MQNLALQLSRRVPSNQKKALRCVEAPIRELTSRFVFDLLPAGNYALGVAHDENGNHHLDYNLFRIPREAYGISNEVQGDMSGPPTLEQAILRVPPTGLTVTVNVK